MIAAILLNNITKLFCSGVWTPCNIISSTAADHLIPPTIRNQFAEQVVCVEGTTRSLSHSLQRDVVDAILGTLTVETSGGMKAENQSDSSVHMVQET